MIKTSILPAAAQPCHASQRNMQAEQCSSKQGAVLTCALSNSRYPLSRAHCTAWKVSSPRPAVPKPTVGISRPLLSCTCTTREACNDECITTQYAVNFTLTPVHISQLHSGAFSASSCTQHEISAQGLWYAILQPTCLEILSHKDADPGTVTHARLKFAKAPHFPADLLLGASVVQANAAALPAVLQHPGCVGSAVPCFCPEATVLV